MTLLPWLLPAVNKNQIENRWCWRAGEENKGNRDKEENGEGEIKENAEEKGKRI